MSDGLTRAITAAGSKAELARKLDLRAKSAVTNWIRNRHVPAAQAVKIEGLFGIPAREVMAFAAPAQATA